MSEPPLPQEIRLGVSQLDGEHGFQITLLRALEQAVARSERKEALELLDQLDDYTNMHFLFEETLMIQRGYPHHEAHRREHEHLIQKLRGLREAVVSTGEAMQVTEAGTFEKWLLEHIQTFDRAFAAYITQSNSLGASREQPPG